VPLKDSTVLCQNERRFVGAPVSRLKFVKVGFVLDLLQRSGSSFDR
jgi:hypothetical protein